MAVLRLVVLILVLFLAWRLLRRWLLPPPSARPPAGEFERMDRCSACGTHVPARELSNGHCPRCR